jgi:hypothetical protein
MLRDLPDARWAHGILCVLRARPNPNAAALLAGTPLLSLLHVYGLQCISLMVMGASMSRTAAFWCINYEWLKAGGKRSTKY